MSKQNLENVFNQLSNVDDLDESLKQEGIDPLKIVETGLKRIRLIQSTAYDKRKLLELIKEKLKSSVSSQTRKTMKTLGDLVPSMSDNQLSMVFSKVNSKNLKAEDIEDLKGKLSNNSDLKEIMKKYKPNK